MQLLGQWVALLLSDLTGLHAIDWVIACFHICYRNLSYGEGTKLDCCDMVAATGDFGMAIITLGRIYFVLSCRDERLDPDLPRGRGKSIDGDLDIDKEGFEHNERTLAITTPLIHCLSIIHT
jgi:hypothetical protein